MKIRLATDEIQRDSIVDGEGIRMVLWTQGCPHHCQGCHNPETHSSKNGVLVDVEEIKKKIASIEGQDGITFSGGDPMMQAESCAELAKFSKKMKLNVWCYTGYTFEELLKLAENKIGIRDFLCNIDVLVDGKFILEEKSYDIIFRGSKNQRLVDVKRSLIENKTVLVTKFDSIQHNNKGRKNSYIFV